MNPMETPIIYSPHYPAPRITMRGRVWALVLMLGSLAVLVTASQVNPDPSGEGTHVALGMLPCQFLVKTGLPCISCGMTTSFAHFARGQWLSAFYVQPMGALLAFLTAATFWSAAYITITARPAHRALRFVPVLPILWFLLIFAFVAWAWKLLIHSGS